MSEDVAQGAHVDAAIADDRDAVMGDGGAVVAAENGAQDDTDRRTGARQRDECGGAVVPRGNAGGEMLAVSGHARFVLCAGGAEELKVARAGRVFGREHFAVMLLAALDERFFDGGIGDGRQLDGFQQEGHLFGAVAAVEGDIHSWRAIWLAEGARR